PIRDRLVSLTATADFSVLGRSEFYQTALRIFTRGPENHGPALFGTGVETYRYVSPLQQTDPRFYSSDPHSTLFQLMAELGLIGIVIYCLAWAWWGWVQTGAGLFQPDDPKTDKLWPGWRIDCCGMLAGLAGGWLHWTLDFDWTFGLIVWTAFAFIALITTALRTRLDMRAPIRLPEGKPPAKGVKLEVPPDLSPADLKAWKLRKILSDILIVVLAFGTINMTAFGISRVFYDAGETAFATWMAQRHVDSLARADQNYYLAQIFYPLDANAVRGQSLVQLWLATQVFASNPEEARETSASARDNAEKAIKLAAYHSTNWYNLAHIDSERFTMGFVDQPTVAENMNRELIFALMRDPINNPSYYVMLTQALSLSPFDDKRDTALTLNVQRLMELYPPESVTEYSKTRLDWQNLPISYLEIWPYYLLALKATGDTEGLARAITDARDYLIPAARDTEYASEEIKGKAITLVEMALKRIEAGEAPGVPSQDLGDALNGVEPTDPTIQPPLEGDAP
ncbi:MAG: O-antigen ligase family protein, partial [bacterium]